MVQLTGGYFFGLYFFFQFLMFHVHDDRDLSIDMVNIISTLRLGKGRKGGTG